MKILLVDDEGIVLRGISTIIKRANKDWEIVAECGSGEEALPAIDYYCPDVVISDIRMYDVSGIDLAESIRERHKDTLVILLTGYADFSYAQKAIRLNIFDYLLKPTRYEDILGCLTRAELHLRELNEKRNLDKDMAARLDESRTALGHKFLQDLMKGLLPVSVNIPEKLIEYKIDLKSFIVLNVCYKSINKESCTDSQDKSLDYGVIDIFSEAFNGVGSMIVLPENPKNFIAIIEGEAMGQNWQESIRKASINAAEKILDELQAKLYMGTSERRGDPEELLDCYNQASYAMELAEKQNEHVIFFTHLNFEHPRNSYSKSIKAAVDYIDHTFQNDITLKEVAEAVYLNVWYLSDLFRREVGKTFSDYVKDKRIQLAKELLKDESLKLYEVAYRIGIKEQSYFSSLFKKETGMTPKKFREQL